jgi:hypothetical protein
VRLWVQAQLPLSTMRKCLLINFESKNKYYGLSHKGSLHFGENCTKLVGFKEQNNILYFLINLKAILATVLMSHKP